MIARCCRQVLADIIVAPLCWKNNEWVGLTVGCSMSEILDSLQDVTEQQDFTFDKYLIGKSISKSSIESRIGFQKVLLVAKKYLLVHKQLLSNSNPSSFR